MILLGRPVKEREQKTPGIRSLVTLTILLLLSPLDKAHSRLADRCRQTLTSTTQKILKPLSALKGVSFLRPKLTLDLTDSDFLSPTVPPIPVPRYGLPREIVDLESDSEAQRALLEDFKTHLQWVESQLLSQSKEGFLTDLLQDPKMGPKLSVFSVKGSTRDSALYLRGPNKQVFALSTHFQESPEILVKSIWDFYLMTFETIKPLLEADLFRWRNNFQRFSLQTNKLIKLTAQWDLRFYRLIQVLQQVDPSFNPLQKLDPGIRKKALNYFYGDHALSRHQLSGEQMAMILKEDETLSQQKLEEWLNKEYCYPLYFRQGVRCAFKGFALYLIAQGVGNLYEQVVPPNSYDLSVPSFSAIVDSSETFFTEGEEVMNKAQELQKLPMAEDLINQRFQQHLKMNRSVTR